MGDSIASPKADSYDRYQAEDDMRTLVRAKEIRADPKRMKGVQRAAKEKLGEMAQIKTLAAGTKAA